MQMYKLAMNVVPTAGLVPIQKVTVLLVFVLLSATLGGLVKDVISTVMYLTVGHVPIKILTYAMNAKMVFIAKRTPLVLHVQVIVLWAHYVTNTTVHVVGDARKTGQENVVINIVLSSADIATNLTNHLVHCARKTPTVTVVNIPAIRDAHHETKVKPAIKATALVILTVKPISGAMSATKSVARVVVEICATGLRVNA